MRVASFQREETVDIFDGCPLIAKTTSLTPKMTNPSPN